MITPRLNMETNYDSWPVYFMIITEKTQDSSMHCLDHVDLVVPNIVTQRALLTREQIYHYQE